MHDDNEICNECNVLGQQVRVLVCYPFDMSIHKTTKPNVITKDANDPRGAQM